MKTINSLRVATLLALAASSASADVSVVNGTLTISDAVGGLNSKIIVGPDPGMVSLYQVPGAADGETYMGIRALRVLSGAGPDQIDLEIEQASSFDVLVDTGAGESAIQVKWIVPPTLERVVPRLDVRPGAGTKRVFFDFDKSTLRADAKATLDKQAAWLKAYPNYAMTIEGHADERGTREYNLALGEKRANAVAMYMKAAGIAATRVKVVSYGKERPVALGSNEAAWSQNRRGVTVLN